MRGYYYGIEFDEDYWEGDDNYEIWARLEPGQRHSWDTLNKLLVPSVTGEMVRLRTWPKPLRPLALLKSTGKPPAIRDGRTRHRVAPGEVAADIEKVLSEVELKPGMRTAVAGDVEDLKETFIQMAALILLG